MDHCILLIMGPGGLLPLQASDSLGTQVQLLLVLRLLLLFRDPPFPLFPLLGFGRRASFLSLAAIGRNGTYESFTDLALCSLLLLSIHSLGISDHLHPLFPRPLF